MVSSSTSHQPLLLFPITKRKLTKYTRNRALSIRHRNTGSSSTGGGGVSGATKMFSFSSLRGTVQPELSKKLYRLIKSENNLISAHEEAGRQRVSIATQLSEWGEQTGDEGISDISDKVGVVLSEVGEQEDTYAHALDDSRNVLKTIRNIEKSVQPSRDNKAKIADEIAKLKLKEPESPRLVVLEQELVRAEAENLVAEAQLTNVVCKTPLFSSTLLVSGGVMLKKRDRRARNSRNRTTPSSSPPSSAPRSRSSWRATACASSSCWTTLPWCQETSARPTRAEPKPDRS